MFSVPIRASLMSGGTLTRQTTYDRLTVGRTAAEALLTTYECMLFMGYSASTWVRDLSIVARVPAGTVMYEVERSHVVGVN